MVIGKPKDTFRVYVCGVCVWGGGGSHRYLHIPKHRYCSPLLPIPRYGAGSQREDKVTRHYTLMRTNQTLEYVQRMEAKVRGLMPCSARALCLWEWECVCVCVCVCVCAVYGVCVCLRACVVPGSGSVRVRMCVSGVCVPGVSALSVCLSVCVRECALVCKCACSWRVGVRVCVCRRACVLALGVFGVRGPPCLRQGLAGPGPVRHISPSTAVTVGVHGGRAPSSPQYLTFDKAEMGVWEAFEHLSTFVDASDPDTEVCVCGGGVGGHSLHVCVTLGCSP
jgi:hypothetical protein